MLKVLLFAPISTSLYSRLVLHGLLREQGVQVVGVAVRSPWNMQRIRSEWKRDGSRLAQKVIRKYLLRENAFRGIAVENLASFAASVQLPKGTLKELAGSWNLPYLVCRDLSADECAQFVFQHAPDVIVFTGGGLIRQNILQIPPLGVLNCHTGILPAYRGMDVVEWTALECAIQKVGFGVSLHYMDKGVDTGPVLLVKRFDPVEGDTFSTIRMRLEVEMVRVMLAGVRGIVSGDLHAHAQTPLAGRQYFVMHPRLKAVAEENLKKSLRNS
jgi:methionyl-tRNA formyltransferase